MRKTFLRFISSAVVIAILFVNNMKVSAVGAPTENAPETVFDMGDTQIEYYETSSGDRIFLQYVNGVLTQKNILPYEQPDIVEREFFVSNGYSRTSAKDIIRPSDYITTTYEEEVLQPTPRASLGTINYRAIIDTGYTYYGLRCSYTTTNQNSTYTIRSYVGTVVDLVSILVSATNLAASIGSTVVRRICVSAGIAITGGVIKSALSTTVACVKSTYKWTLVDTTLSAHSKNVYGYKYHVTDSNYHTGDDYYEGYQPSDWRTQALAVWFHNEMFAYSAWDVVGWN